MAQSSTKMFKVEAFMLQEPFYIATTTFFEV